jgi:hypothetical protein
MQPVRRPVANASTSADCIAAPKAWMAAVGFSLDHHARKLGNMLGKDCEIKAAYRWPIPG